MRYAEEKSDCLGSQSVGTKVDESTRRFIVESAQDAGLTTAEFLRRIIDVYRESMDGNVDCYNCGAAVNLAPGVRR